MKLGLKRFKRRIYDKYVSIIEADGSLYGAKLPLGYLVLQIWKNRRKLLRAACGRYLCVRQVELSGYSVYQ